MARQFLPVEMIFNPNWWHRNYGVSFDLPFYMDRQTRIDNDVMMRRALYERFGVGEPNPQPRPVIGSMQVAGGFVLPALFGAEFRFAPYEAPWPIPTDMSEEQIRALKVPDLETTWPMSDLIADMDALEKEHGYVLGDFDTDGILNTALHLRGHQIFLDMYDKPELAHFIFKLLAETYDLVANYMRRRTGSAAIGTNRSILNVDPGIYLHSNCTMQMVSPETFAEFLLPYELYLAERLQPYGIHHCGNNLHLFAEPYGKVPCSFFDVGWGSDPAKSREAYPNAFLNIRMCPVRMLQESAAEIRKDAERLLTAVGPLDNVGLCCINMDYGTSDENVRTMMQVADEFRRRAR